MGPGEEAEEPATLVLKRAFGSGLDFGGSAKTSSDLLSPPSSYTPRWLQVTPSRVDGETAVQRRQVAYSRSHSKLGTEQGLGPLPLCYSHDAQCQAPCFPQKQGWVGGLTTG